MLSGLVYQLQQFTDALAVLAVALLNGSNIPSTFLQAVVYFSLHPSCYEVISALVNLSVTSDDVISRYAVDACPVVVVEFAASMFHIELVRSHRVFIVNERVGLTNVDGTTSVTRLEHVAKCGTHKPWV